MAFNQETTGGENVGLEEDMLALNSWEGNFENLMNNVLPKAWTQTSLNRLKNRESEWSLK